MDSGFTLLLPTEYYIAGGTLAVAASVAVAALLPARWSLRLFTPVTLWRGAMAAPRRWSSHLGLALILALILTGFFGERDPLENPLPLTIWTLWWVGLAVLCALIGNVWRLIEPWSGVFDRLCYRDTDAPLRLPERIGYAPAILGLMAFGWFENADIAPQDPARLAWVTLAYLIGTFATMALFGPEEWRRRGECFSVFFRLIGRLAPLQVSTRAIRIGVPGFALMQPERLPLSGAIFVLVALATISFDGLSETFLWLSWIGINPLEFPGRSAVVTEKTVGFLIAWAAIALLYLGCMRLGAALANDRDWRGLAAALAPSVLPIALAYHFAHYLTGFLVNVQYLWTDHASASFLNDLHGVERIWQAQSGAIVAGHVIAVLLAHAILLQRYETSRHAALAGLPLALFMIGYTGFGLWLLATPSGA